MTRFSPIATLPLLVLLACRGSSSTAAAAKPTTAVVNPNGSSGCSTVTPAFNAVSEVVASGAFAPYTLTPGGALAADASSNVAYVAIAGPAPGPAILKIDVDTGTVTPFADAARFAAFDPAVSNLSGLAILDHDTLFVVDSSTNRILSVTASAIAVFAGIASPTGGYADGSLGSCLFRFSAPTQPAVGGDGVVYVADPGNERIRKIAGGVVTTLAGSGVPGYLDGTGTGTRFESPDGVAIECTGNLLVTEGANRIRRITFKVQQSPFAGSQTLAVVSTLAGNGDPQSVDGLGGPTGPARVFAPAGISVGQDGTIFWLDRGTGLIRRILPAAGDPVVSTPDPNPSVAPLTSFGLTGAFAEGLLVDTVNNRLLQF